MTVLALEINFALWIMALAALVREYGPEYIIDVVQFIGFELAENEYNQAIAREGKL